MPTNHPRRTDTLHSVVLFTNILHSVMLSLRAPWVILIPLPSLKDALELTVQKSADEGPFESFGETTC